MAERVPLTGCQRELWLSTRAALTEYTETSIRGCYYVDAMLDPERLREAVRLVLRFTPLPAATLCQDEEEPYFLIGENQEPDFRFLDASAEPNPAAAADRLIDEFYEEPVENPLIRYALVRTGRDSCIIAMKCCHLVLDGLAFFFHVAVIADFYTALARGETPNPGEPCACGAAYVEEQAHFGSARFEKDMAFWERHLARLPEKRMLRPLPGCADVLGSSRHKKFILSDHISRMTEALIEAHKVSPAVFFTAIYSLIVSFMSGEKEIVALAPVAYGERKVLYRRQGAMMALPPLLVNVDGAQSFAGLLEEIAAQNASFYRHVRTPYQFAARRLEGKNFAYVADAFVNFLPNTPPGTPEFPIIAAEQRHSEKEPILFGMLVMQEPRTGRFSLTVRSSRNHLSEQDVERFVARVEKVIAQIDSGVDMAQLDYVLDEEQRELALWGRGAVREYSICSLPELFDATVERFADNSAVKDEWGNTLSYADVRENSLCCARWLAARGVGQGDVVAVAAQHTANLAEVVLGIQRIGAVYLPVDTEGSPERLAYIMENAGAAFSFDLADLSYRHTPPETGPALPPAPAAEQGAYLIYTSGSTGKPKGVLAPHGGFANMIQGQIELFGVGVGDHVLQFAPPIFDASLSEMFMALLAGACLYPVSDQCRNAPWTLKRYMADNGITVATLPPSYLNLFEGEAFPGLRVLITAGEPPVAADALHYARSLRYFNAYGPTETCVCATMKEVSPAETLPISIGRPIPNVTLSIRDAQGRELPAGMGGELWIGGGSLALGYHNRPDLTEQRFKLLPGGAGRAYASGDLAMWSPCGEVVLMGRADDQVKIRGNRVELAEVSFLLETCESVSQAVVLAVKDAGGQAVLAAFFVLRQGANVESVITWCRSHLPGYMVPSAWHVLDAMPRAATGKVDRKTLQAMAQQKQTPQNRTRRLDARLLAACEHALGRACDPEKSFFAQGGNSLNAMRLLHSIRKTFGVDIPFRNFVPCETLFDVEDLLGESRAEVCAPRVESAPLSLSQYRIWAYQQANEGAVDYNMPLLLEVRGPQTEKFLEGLCRAINEQELLRCTVVGEIDSPRFALGAVGEIPLRSVNIADAAAAMAFFDAQIHTPFDLRRQPPVKLFAARLPGCMQILVLVHHLAGDGETIEILLQNALRHVHGEASAAGLLAAQEGFCRRESAYVHSPAWKEDSAYWRSILEPPVPPVNPSAENAVRRQGAMAGVDLSAGAVRSLETMAAFTGASTLSCFVALLGRFLCRRFGRRELLVGVPMGLRETQAEFSAAGFYVNTVPVRVGLDLAADAAITATAEQMRRATMHSRYCVTEMVPEFLATHAHFESITDEGLAVHRLEPQLRASKLTGSFTLETGATNRIILEYDAGFITDAESLLADLAREITQANLGLAQRAPQQALADAWRKILHSGSTKTANESSDFFRDGGDSIKAIQITGILRRSGITALSAPDFLRTPRFADLCALLGRAGGKATTPETAPVSREVLEAGHAVPLLPLARHFISAHPRHWKHFYMLLPLELGAEVKDSALKAWLHVLPENHEALRLAFTLEQAVVLGKPQSVVLRRRSFDAAMARQQLLHDAVRELTAELDPEQGKTLGAMLAEQGGRRFLLLVGHHLVLDTFSLEALRAELLHYCRTGEVLRETHGLAQRALAMEKLAVGRAFPSAEEAGFWAAVCAEPMEALCALAAEGRDKASERASLDVRLEGFRLEYASDAQGDLVSALACALHRQGQRAPVCLTLESHGRDELLPGFDFSRSVGWFTAVCPMPLVPAASCGEARASVCGWLAKHYSPAACNAYGYLRARDPRTYGYTAQIAFNYLGKITASDDGATSLMRSALAPGAVPELLHQDFEPDSPLELSAWFEQDGALHLGAYFSPGLLPSNWVSGLLERWRAALQTLPAYLPDATLAAIYASCGCEKADVERIAQPDSTHEAQLYQSLLPGRGVYVQQVEFYFSGALDEQALMRAWKTVIARHESLRSLFAMPVAGEFYRVALRVPRTSLELHDFSRLPEHSARAEMDALLRAQRERGFDVRQGPLLRAQFFRLDGNRIVMGWCFHHLLMDGWCMGILLRELFTLCGAGEERASNHAALLPRSFALENYERWRSRFDEHAARTYWAGLLQDFAGSTGVTAHTDDSNPAEIEADHLADPDPETVELELDAELSEALQTVARDCSVTLPVLVQTLWAFVLGAANGSCRDVVFGVVTSGRPAELEGIDSAVGLFIQTLPLRVRWSAESPLPTLLAEVKEQSLQQMRFGYVPLAAMGRDLLDHLMVFENYPIDAVFNNGRVTLEDMRGFEKIPYPLGISVIPGKNLRFRFLFDPARLPHQRLHALCEGLLTALRTAAGQPDLACRAFENAVDKAVKAANCGETLAQATVECLVRVADESQNVVGSTFPAPDDADSLEQALLEGYTAVLGRSVPSMEADFFQLGGHSLLALRLLAWLNKNLHVSVGIKDIMGNPSPRALAACIRHAAAPQQRIPRVQSQPWYPLAPAQQRIWFLQKLHEDGSVYVIPFAAKLRAPVNPQALQTALTMMEARHDALRLRVAVDSPEQMLAAPGGLTLELRDEPFTAAAYKNMLQELGQTFGTDRPLARIALFREADGGNVVLFCFHHIIFDGWSAEIFTRELNQAYDAALRGVAPAWESLALDYLSCAVWEAQREPSGLEEMKNVLAPLPERLRLPLDFPRSARQSFTGSVLAFDFGRERSLALKHFSRQEGMTVFPVLLALVDAFLYRHTGQDDIVLGCPAANREREQTQGVIGLFVNTLAVRAQVDGGGTFASLARSVDAAFQKALAGQSCPFEKLIEALGVERNAAQNPVFDVFVALEDASWADFGREPLHMEPLDLPHANSKFDLSFYFRERADGGYDVHLEYCTELFRPETLGFMAERLVMLADAVLQAENASIADLDILPQGELALLAAWNDTAETLDTQTGMDARFRAQVERTPAAPAVLDASGLVLSYAEFDARVAAMCSWLEDQGVNQGNYVCVCFERSLDMMVCIFAVLRAGAVYVPLSGSMPEDRLRSVFEDLGSCVVLCDPRFAEKFGHCGQRVIAPGAEICGENALNGAIMHNGQSSAPDSLAYVIFTSGSTGRPKGVQIEQRSVGNRLGWMQARFPIGREDVVLQKTAVTFDVSVWELFWWSWQGASLALLEPEAEKDPAAIVAAVEDRRVTVLHFVPSMLRAFLDHLEFHHEDVPRLATLRYVFTSGEALPRELAVRFNALLRAELHNLYGPTEATVDVSWQPCLQTPPHVMPIGRPVSNTRLYVLDARNQPVPIGVTGEIYISGVQVARGYANRPDLTAQRFMDDPFTPGNRMYRTGDLGRWNVDGCIEYLGRNDDQVKIRGFRIELGEVEAALGRCAGVAQAVVRVGRIGEYAALEAFLLPQNGVRLDLAGIRAGLAMLLPEYMHPGQYYVTTAIPLSSSGKADRKKISGELLGGTPLASSLLDPSGAGRERAGQAKNDKERALLAAVRAVWREVMPEVDAGPDQGFFEVGGNSLLLVRLHALLDRQWPGLFTLAGLFSESSMLAQARFIARAQSVPCAAVPRACVNAPVAVIGMAVRLGDYEDTESFWHDLATGADKNVPLPEKRRREVRQIFEAAGLAFDPEKLREASYLSDISSFDYKRFGLSPNDASLLDPAQRIFLETALRALDDAGYGGTALQNRNVGVFVGASPVRLFQSALTQAFPHMAEQIYLLNVPSNVVARLSYLKNWNGPAASVDTACSSVLAALHEACRSLREGESGVALAGGAHIIDMPVKADTAFAIESSSGRTRTFDAGAEGVGAGEGAAVFVLKLLDAAVRDNDAIHAVILGSAVNQDGKSSSMAAPNPDAQAGVIAQAAQSAGVSLADIQFFEAHGTATVLGDPVEIEGLRRAFARENVVREHKAFIGSVKGNLGHLDAAAGAAGLAKVILCLEKGFVPPQPHFERPNPHIDFDAAPVRVAQRLEPLPQEERPWRCGISSFGLSGVNTHVVAAEHRAPALPEDDGSWLCVPLSAPDAEGLRVYARQLGEALAAHAQWPLHAVAATLVAGREHMPVRAVVVAHTRQELAEQLAGDIHPVVVPRHSGGQNSEDGQRNSESGVRAAGFAAREEAEAAAQAYLRGQELFWPAERALFRLHLPAAPFARTTLWPRFAAKFVSDPVATPAGTAYAVAMNRMDFWPVAEHKIENMPILVGMGLLDLVGMVAGPVPLNLADLRWRRPVASVPGSRVTLMVKETDAATLVELQYHAQGAWHVAASASIPGNAVQHGATPPVPIHPADLISSMHPLTPEGGPSVISVSRRWQCRENLWISASGNRLLAQLCLPEEYRFDLNTFRWHPAMMDIAASLALHGVSGFVPAACGAARLYRALPAQAYALVTVTDRQAGMITADCTVADLSGQVLVELNDMVFMALRGAPASIDVPQGGAEAPKPELYGVEWRQAESTRAEVEQASVGQTSVEQIGVPPTANILLLGASGHPLVGSLVKLARLRRVLPEQPEDIKQLAVEIAAQGVEHVLYVPEEKDDYWELCCLLQEISRAGLRHDLRVTVASVGAAAGEPFSAAQAEAALRHTLYQGPLLCLPWEEPRISCACVETEGVGPAAIAALWASLGSIDGPYIVAANGAVRTRVLEKLDVAPISAISDKGCVVITGGLGGMGLTLAEQIRSRHGARVVLLSRRTPAAHSGQKHDVPQLPFDVFTCDVTNAAQVEKVFARIRKEAGPIQGIIHAAGLPGKGYLLTGKQQEHEAVLAPKVAGTWNIHNATRGDNLAFFVLASSRTALVGAPGQSDYTAANAFLNAFACYRLRLGLPALSICWNTWSGVGMAARHGLEQASQAATMLAPEQALNVLEAALASGRELVVVGMSSEDVSSFSLNGLPQGEPAQRGTALREVVRPSSASGSAPVSQRASQPDAAALLEIIRDCLGYEKTLTREDDFFDLGGDSIAATRIVTRLEKEAGVKLDVADLLESDNLGQIIDRALDFLKARHPASEGGAKAALATPVLEKYPVGNEQLAILYADMVSEGDLGFNLPAFLVMPENLDRQKLQKALGQLVERHEALRTSFCDFDAERPNMVIHPFEGFTLEDAHIPDLASKDAFIRPFNLRKEGGFRAVLLAPETGPNVLFFDVHHALADGRTISLLNAELFQLYHGQPLEPVSAQMKDLAWIQVTHPDKEAAAYWQNKYRGELPKLDLPSAHGRPRVHTGRGGMYEFALAPELVQGVKALARREGVTPYHVSLCAWSLLVQAYTGNRDVVLAVSVDGRGEHLNTAGMLASVLPLRFDVNPDLPLKELLRNTRHVSNEGMRHRAYILNNLLADLRQTAWPDRSPLSEIILSYMNFEFAAAENGLFETLRFSKHASKTDISIFGSDTGRGISFALEYYADLFSEADVARMARDYTRLVELMTTAGPDAPMLFAPEPTRADVLRGHTGEVPASVGQGVHALAAARAVGPDAVMLAVFAALMSRITQRGRFSISVNGCAVAFSIEDDMEFDDLLANTHAQLRNAGNLASTVSDVAMGEQSLRLGFAYAHTEHNGQPRAENPGHDLLCFIQEQGGELSVHFDYDPKRLSDETAQNWLAYYQRFLEGVIEGNA